MNQEESKRFGTLSYSFSGEQHTVTHNLFLDIPEEGEIRRVSIYFTQTRHGNESKLRYLDGLVCAVIFYCMQENLNLVVNGKLSRRFLQNINLFMESWTLWFPSLYTKIEISGSTNPFNGILIIKDLFFRRPREISAITPLSGGVDSTFTLLRHKNSDSLSRFEISHGVFVHGFDIPSSDDDAAKKTSGNLRNLASRYGIKYSELKTDLRDQLPLTWEHAHGAALSSVLHLFSNHESSGLIPSAQAVDGVLTPWGTHPATDTFLGGEALSIFHDGAGFSRFEKIRYLVGFPEICRQLRVCWSGEYLSKNCASCEKCLRTMAAIELAGGSPVDAFGKALSAKSLEGLFFENSRIRKQWIIILDLAEESKVLYPWTGALRAVLNSRPA
jgi:hypothetical protein